MTEVETNVTGGMAIVTVAMVVALLLTVGSVWANPASAQAQLELVASDPPDGAILVTPPQAVTLTFTEVSGTVSIITVHDPSGRPVSTDTAALAGVDSLRVPLAVLTEPGRYETRYLLTTVDGPQKLAGVLTFTLAVGPDIPESAADTHAGEDDVGQAWSWLVVALVAVVAGGAGHLRLNMGGAARWRFKRPTTSGFAERTASRS